MGVHIVIYAHQHILSYECVRPSVLRDLYKHVLRTNTRIFFQTGTISLCAPTDSVLSIVLRNDTRDWETRCCVSGITAIESGSGVRARGEPAAGAASGFV